MRHPKNIFIFYFFLTTIVSFAQLPLDTMGWTVLSPSSDSRIIYVSDSFGNDGNNGLSPATPKQTVAAGYALLRHGYPDWLLFRRGDAWNAGTIYLKKSGRSATEPLVIGSYGDSTLARPILKTDSSAGISVIGGGGAPAQISNFVITSIYFSSNTRVPGTTDYTSPAGTTCLTVLRPGENILIEDCYFDHYKTSIVVQATEGQYSIKNVKVRRCVLADSYSTNSHSQGIYASGIDGLLIEENVMDHNGWHDTLTGAQATIFNHNMYIQTGNNDTNLFIRGNISARAASHGLQLRPGGVCEDNLFLQNALHMFIASYGGIVRNNVALYGKDIDGAGRGMGFSFNNKMPYALMEHNIIAHKNTSDWGEAYDINAWLGPGANQSSPVPAASYTSILRENISYDWKGYALQIGPSSFPEGYDSLSILVEGNDFQDNFSSHMISAGHGSPFGLSSPQYGTITFLNNRYYTNEINLGTYNDHWFRISNPTPAQYMDSTQWLAASGETGASFSQVSYLDPNRDISTYQTSISGTNTLEAFLEEAKKQRKGYWRDEYMAKKVNCYIREGFQKPISYTTSFDDTICAGHHDTLRISGLNTTKYSISWSGGVPTSNTSFVVSPTTTTTYEAEIIDSTQLWKMCAPIKVHFTVAVNTCSGIEKNNNDYFSVFPNPATNEIHLLFNSPIDKNAVLTITNSLGQTVYFSNVVTGKISLEGFSKGIYSLHIASENKNLLKKIVVQ